MLLFTLTCLVKAEAEGDSVNCGQGVSVSFELLAMVLNGYRKSDDHEL